MSAMSKNNPYKIRSHKLKPIISFVSVRKQTVFNSQKYMGESFVFDHLKQNCLQKRFSATYSHFINKNKYTLVINNSVTKH